MEDYACNPLLHNVSVVFRAKWQLLALRQLQPQPEVELGTGGEHPELRVVDPVHQLKRLEPRVVGGVAGHVGVPLTDRSSMSIQ